MTVTVGLYVEQHIYDHYGYDPADTMSSLMADTLSYNGINDWSVTVNTEIPLDTRETDSSGDPIYQTVGDALDGFGQWLNDQGIYGNKDCQHLILDSSSIDGLGVASAGGPDSVAIGELLNNIDAFNPPRFNEMNYGGDHTVGDEVNINMQESAHCLGLCPDSDHNCGMHYFPEDVSWSVPDTTDSIYTTPMEAGRDGTDNSCGETTRDADYWVHTIGYQEYSDAYYWDNCAGKKLRQMWN